MPSYHSGQSLTEYALIGVLVCVAAIPALALLGDNLGQGLISLKSLAEPSGQTTAPTQDTASTPESATASDEPSPADAPSGASGSPTQDPPAQGMTLQLADGSQITLPGYSQDLRKTIETLGANGATALLASQVVEVADQLLASGEINEQQYATLVKLSNQGHRLAMFERVLEEHYTPANSGAFDRKTFTIDGKSYTGKQIHSIMGFNTDIGDRINDPLRDSASTEISKLQSLYWDLQKSGALSNPGVDTVVSGLTSQIALINQYCNNMDNASSLTDINAVGICTVGNGKDTGIHCTG